MQTNQPKIVGFDTNPVLAVPPGAQALLTLTAPICFIGKRLVVDAFDNATGNNLNCIINSIRWNNQDLLAGGPIFSNALPTVWTTGGSNSGAHLKWTIPVEVADTFNIVVTNQGGAAIAILAYWVTDYGGSGCC